MEVHTVGLSSSSWVSAVGECVDGVFSIFFDIIFDNNFLFTLHGVCELHIVDGTTTDKIDCLFILVLLSAVPHHQMQFAVLPPFMFAKVAPVLCVSFGVLHLALVCAHLP